MTATEGIYDCYTIGDVISKFRGTGSGPSRAAAMMIYNYTAAGTIRNCWAQGAYAFPEWDPHWALSFQRLEPFLAMIEANGVNTSATAEAPAKLSSAFNEDGTLVWQGKAAAATYAVRFANGEEDVTADIAVEGGTLREDGVYRLQNGTYSYSGSVKVGEESIPVSGAFNVANIGKVIPLTSKINFDLPDGAAVSVTREGGGAVLTADADGAYKLPNGAYAYTVTKEGCESVSGAFGADGNSRTIKIAALRSLVRVVFTGLPAGAALTLLRDGLPVDPDAAGTRVYTLADGIEYTYAAGAEGFVGVTGTYTASAAETSKAITLAPAGAEVTITTLPADASVELRDASGAVIPPRADGRTYMLAANTDYDYTARAPYHEDKTGTLKSSDGDLTLTLARSVVRITFVTSPSGAEVTVTRAEDGAAQAPGEDGGKTFDLEAGYEYAYTVRAPYHADKTGSLFADKAKNVEETPVRNTVTAVFNVNPASAAFALTQGGRTVSPVSVGGGSYTYALGQGLIYSYSASAGGYNGTTREYVALTDGDTTDVELTNSAYGSNFISGNGYIGDAEVTEANKGVFSVAAGATGTITVNTAKPITLVGRGTDRGSLYENLFIDCLAAGADITLKDLYISEVIPSHTQVFYNALNFRGAGNKLNFSGTNIIDVDTNMSDKAAIHVPAGAELALGGLTDGDTLYLYKSNQAAGIGGNENEYNGDITFVRGNLFAKNSKQGALIGSGSGASAETASAPGDVTILGGSLCLLPISMGAGIGGSAGGSGGAKGTDVYMKGGTLTINVDYTGAAIGGGGYRGGNDAEGGTLHYLGGSIRVFIDENAVNSGDSVNEKWPVDKAGVSDVAITAKKVDAAGKEVYAFAFDTSLLKAPANIFTVADGEGTIYAGGLHKYSYINENRQKNAQLGISYTMDNWVPLSDPNLYLYLTGEDHTLTVNGELFTATWKGKAQGFHITAGARRGVSVGSVTGGGSLSADKAAYVSGETVTVTVLPDEGRRLKAGSLLCSYGGADHAITETNGVYSFTMPEAEVTLTAVFEEIPPDAPRRAITIAAGITGGTLAIADGKTEAAAGERVAVTVTPARGKQLAAGSPKANGTSLARGEDGAYGFLMPDEAVTITAVFEDIGIETPNGVLFKTGAAQDLKLTINKAFALFAGNVTLKHNATGLVTYLAQADNEEKDNNDYRAEEGGTEEGGTVITVFKLYTDTLSEGDYTLAVHFGDGTVAEKSFSVRDTPVFKIVVDPAVTAGELTPDKTQAAAGEEITVTVRPGEGLRLVPGSLKWDGRAINADETGKYAFTMPAWDCLLTAEFIEVNAPVTPPEQGADEEAFKEGIKGTGDIRAAVWDGKSIDLRWFDPDKSSYTISTPAELAGLAALVNGLYNREIDTIAGKAAYIRVNTGLGDDDGPQGNNKSTATYHYGDYNFADKTVRLGADIYMGEGNNYMPIGGQYLMTKNKSETRVDASFNGVFDGRGHSVYIYTDRHVSGGNFGDGSSVGLIGRLGVHDNDAQSLRASGLAVKNVAVYGSVRANRSVGGIVGKIGKTADNCAVIENCANFASVSSTDAKGVGGIAGAAWNGGVIRDCYNAGTVSGTHTNPAGGIAGSVEVSIENSYSRGGVTAPADYAMGIGTNSGGGSYTNSYYLAGSARDGGWYTGGSDGSFDKSGERTAEYMTSDDFVRDLGTGFVKDTYKINKGYPVLRWQGGTAVSGGGNEETPGAKPSVDVPAKTTVKEGEAVTVVEIPDADVPLAGGESARLVVNVDTGGEAVNKVTAELPKAFVKQAAESKSEVEIKSDLAAVLLPEKAVESLAAENKDIAVKAAKDEAAGGYTFTVEAGGKALAAVDGGIKALVPAPEANAGTVAVLVREDGTEEVIKKSAVKDGTVNVPLAGSATVKIIDNAKDFADVAADAWYGDAVKFASSHELFTGTGEEAFSPEASMTRAMLVTVLHRLEDEPLAAGELFTDVNASGYYAAAVDWASANGIAEGLGDGRFAPAGEITREQLAAFLCRYARSLGADVSAPGDISLFMDAKDVSSWAQEAMEWAVGAGLITGRSNIIGTELAPKDTATRAEVAAILRRFVEKVL
jgi:hypothetical protein